MMNKGTLYKGYYIRLLRVGKPGWDTQLTGPFLAPEGQLPAEWVTTRADAGVAWAELFSSTQRGRQAQKRKIIARFHRSA
jgi:hypothetical protein